MLFVCKSNTGSFYFSNKRMMDGWYVGGCEGRPLEGTWNCV